MLLASFGAPTGDALMVLCHQCSTQCNLVDVNEHTHMHAVSRDALTVDVSGC